MARIVIHSGASAGKIQEFSDKLNIGRDQSNDLVLLDKKISGKHALIFFDHGSYMLMDLDSTNGTRLNGNKITPKVPTTMRDGDRIQLESYTFSFEVGEDVKSPKPFHPGTRIGGESIHLDHAAVQEMIAMSKWLKLNSIMMFIIGTLIYLSAIGGLIAGIYVASKGVSAAVLSIMMSLVVIGWAWLLFWAGRAKYASSQLFLIYAKGAQDSNLSEAIKQVAISAKLTGIVWIILIIQSLLGILVTFITVLP